jgi:hypothetical protein
MAILTGRSVQYYNVVASILSVLRIKIIGRAPLSWFLHKMEEVFVGEFQTITLGPRRCVGFVPDKIVAKYPATALHLYRKTSWY